MVIYKARKSIRYGLDRRYWIDGWFYWNSGLVSSGKTYLGRQEGRWCECTYLHTDRNFAHAVAYLWDIDECDLDYRCQHCSADNDNSDCFWSLPLTDSLVFTQEVGFCSRLFSGQFQEPPPLFPRLLQ